MSAPTASYTACSRWGVNRPTSRKRTSTALVDEYAQLAYHSGRATDPDMNIEIKTDFDPSVPMIQSDLSRPRAESS